MLSVDGEQPRIYHSEEIGDFLYDKKGGDRRVLSEIQVRKQSSNACKPRLDTKSFRISCCLCYDSNFNLYKFANEVIARRAIDQEDPN